LETRILTVGDFDLIDIRYIGYTNKDISEIERILKALITSIENKHSNPCPLESLAPFLQIYWRRFETLNRISIKRGLDG
jgi:hypothetical protein